MVRLEFHSAARMNWLRDIAKFRSLCVPGVNEVVLSFPGIELSELTPVLIVTLACLVECFNKNRINVNIDRRTTVGEELFTKYRLKEYWLGGQNYAEAKDDSILNLQRISAPEKDFYGLRVGEYLKRRYFKSKDMTPVSNSITEAYYNIFDHAEADGNAFSMLSFDIEKSKLSVAVCDFGIGIAKTVKDFLKLDMPDEKAIHIALEDKFTIKSSSHNSGAGLGNIVSSCTEKDFLWLISNRGALAINDGFERQIALDFSFDGTLLFYTMSLDHFEDEEVINEFDW